MENYLHQIEPLFLELCRETGAAATLCDAPGNIIAHCGGGADACRHMRRNGTLLEACNDCDKAARRRLAEGCDLFGYVCHAGLLEVAAAIRGKDGTLEGYIIMGKFLAVNAVEATKKTYRKLLSRTDLDHSALRASFRALPILKTGELKDAIRLLAEIARKFAAEGLMKGFCDPDMQRIIQLVGMSEKEKVTCEALYGTLAMSRRPLGRKVERCCGEKLDAFLDQRTMIRAEDLLMNTSFSVDTIAEQLGYDLSSFINFFKRLYGDTPGNFRKFGQGRTVRFESALAARSRFLIPI